MAESRDAIGLFLQQIGRFPLLTHQEELELGAKIQRMIKLREKPNLTEEERAVLTAGMKARDYLVNCNLRLVVSVVKKNYQTALGVNIEFLDLVNEGVIGLQRAAELFDPGKGYKFSTYSFWWIKQAIARYIENQVNGVRLPSHVYGKLREIKKLYRKSLEQNKPFRISEAAAEVSLSLDALKHIDNIRTLASLDLNPGKGDDTIVDIIADKKTASPERVAEQEDLSQLCHYVLDELPYREREILKMTMGFYGEPMTLKAASEILNLTAEGVRKIKNQALRKARKFEPLFRDYQAS
ncbi:MAG TPA: sigma-70 family RNA polymerase sigma factor [Allocoleopsis sp.]